MSLRLVKASFEIEMNDELHLPRILFLLVEADNRSSKSIEGIMKLAKLDFLLRYPNCLERLLIFLKKNQNKVNLKPYERTSIESKMIRFRYGPWDNRYRRWIGILVAKGLAKTYKEGRTIFISITNEGKEIASKLSELPEFSDLSSRSKLIYTTIGSRNGTNLKSLIYEVFPEILDMKWGQNIQL